MKPNHQRAFTLKRPGHVMAIKSAEPFQLTFFWREQIDIEFFASYRSKTYEDFILPTFSIQYLREKFIRIVSSSDGIVDSVSRGRKYRHPFILRLEYPIRWGDMQGVRFFVNPLYHEHVLFVVQKFNQKKFPEGWLALETSHGFTTIVPFEPVGPGQYCVLAHLELVGIEPILRNVNSVQDTKPSVESFLQQFTFPQNNA